MIALSHIVKKQGISSIEALMGTFKKEALVGVMCWALKPHLLKALVLPTFTYSTNIECF